MFGTVTKYSNINKAYSHEFLWLSSCIVKSNSKFSSSATCSYLETQSFIHPGKCKRISVFCDFGADFFGLQKTRSFEISQGLKPRWPPLMLTTIDILLTVDLGWTLKNQITCSNYVWYTEKVQIVGKRKIFRESGRKIFLIFND